MEINATILLQLAIFLSLLAWLSKVLFAPLLAVFDEREKRIEGAGEQALLLRASADEAASHIEARMLEAQAESRRVLQELRESAANVERGIVQEARDQALARLEDARADLFAATEDTRASLKEDSQKLAAEIVQKVLGRAA